MKAFTVKQTHAAHAARKARPYAHHPMGPLHHAQRTAMRKILRPDEMQAESDMGQTDGNYRILRSSGAQAKLDIGAFRPAIRVKDAGKISLGSTSGT